MKDFLPGAKAIFEPVGNSHKYQKDKIKLTLLYNKLCKKTGNNSDRSEDSVCEPPSRNSKLGMITQTPSIENDFNV